MRMGSYLFNKFFSFVFSFLFFFCKFISAAKPSIEMRPRGWFTSATACFKFTTSKFCNERNQTQIVKVKFIKFFSFPFFLFHVKAQTLGRRLAHSSSIAQRQKGAWNTRKQKKKTLNVTLVWFRDTRFVVYLRLWAVVVHPILWAVVLLLLLLLILPFTLILNECHVLFRQEGQSKWDVFCLASNLCVRGPQMLKCA